MNDRAAAHNGATAQDAYRVQVVDDDPDMAGYLARLLQRVNRA